MHLNQEISQIIGCREMSLIGHPHKSATGKLQFDFSNECAHKQCITYQMNIATMPGTLSSN